jgi:uncharacterized protein (TIGR02300 family)
MSTAKKKPSKSAAKPPARKAVSPKGSAAARKKPAKAAPRREEPPAAPAPARSRPASRAKAASPAASAPSPGDVRSHLGGKWVCFSCGAKFYDLNRPQPLCPKCGANQHDRPKRDPKPKAAEPVAVREIEPDREVLHIEGDEDEALIMDDEEIDLGGGEIEGDAEEFAEEEEEEEPGDS